MSFWELPWAAEGKLRQVKRLDGHPPVPGFMGHSCHSSFIWEDLPPAPTDDWAATVLVGKTDVFLLPSCGQTRWDGPGTLRLSQGH